MPADGRLSPRERICVLHLRSACADGDVREGDRPDVHAVVGPVGGAGKRRAIRRADIESIVQDAERRGRTLSVRPAISTDILHFHHEVSPFRHADGGYGKPTLMQTCFCRSTRATERSNSPDASRSRRQERGERSVVMRPRRLTGTSRRPLIGWP